MHGLPMSVLLHDYGRRRYNRPKNMPLINKHLENWAENIYEYVK